MTAVEPNLHALLRLLEERLLLPSIRSDPEAVSALLDDAFVEFGSSGQIFGKETILTRLAGEAPLKLSLSDFNCQRLGSKIALVTYRSHRTTETGAEISALRSSIWMFDGGQWRIRFHQGTRL